MAGASFYPASYLYNHSRHGNDTENGTLLQPVNGTGIPIAQWTVLPVFSLLVFLAAFFGNGLLLLVFIKERQLRTPFNVYIINLLFANFVLVLIQYPMDIVTNLYNAWLLGHRACQLYLYANSVIGMELESQAKTKRKLLKLFLIFFRHQNKHQKNYFL